MSDVIWSDENEEWLALSWAANHEIIRRDDVFSAASSIMNDGSVGIGWEEAEQWDEILYVRSRCVQELDGRPRPAMRKDLESNFRRKSVEWYKPRLEATAEKYIALLHRERDVVKIANWYGAETMAMLMGMPRQASFKHIADAIAFRRGEEGDDVWGAWRRLGELFEWLYDQKVEAKRGDVFSAFVRGAQAGHYSKVDAIANGVMFYAMGMEEMSCAISNALADFLFFPRQWKMLGELQTDQEWEIATNEMLRFSSPIKANLRIVKQDVLFYGADLRKGDTIVWSATLANRDPKVFDKPDEIDIRRTPNPHLTFGPGIHNCIGAHYVRACVQAFVREMREKHSYYICDLFPLDLEYAERDGLRSLVSLPVLMW